MACRSTDAKRGLMRVVRLADGTVCYDSKGKMSGRGAYVCARRECIQLARKQKKLERSLKVSNVPELVFTRLEAQIADPSDETGAGPALSVAAGSLVDRSKQVDERESTVRIAADSSPISALPTRERVEGSGGKPQESEE